jgi:hypothetical protein
MNGTAIRNLFATHAPRDPYRTSTRLRPALMALEDRRLLATFVVNSASQYTFPNMTNLPQRSKRRTRRAVTTPSRFRRSSTRRSAFISMTNSRSSTTF